MGNDWEILCATQGQFIDYIKGQEDRSNRIIFYKHNGHFGVEFAILSRYKDTEIINFKQLKGKTGKNITFRIIHIIAAVGAFILNVSKDIDARTSITTILNNMENIYLGVEKEREYLKYLRIKKYPHKYGKVQFVVRIEESDIESDEDIQCLKLLCKLIKEGNINNTILLISGEQLSFLNLGIQHSNANIPLFQLTENDLRFIAKRKEIEFTEAMQQNINLVKQFGLQFFIDNYSYFEALFKVQDETFDWIKKMDWIIGQMIQRGNITNKQIYPLLEFASFFENNFSKIEIQNFENNKLEADNLDIAYKLTLISKEKASPHIIPTYFFKIDSFKYYFANKYFKDLEPMPEYIYQYFRTRFPFAYLPALRVLQVDSSFVNYEEKQSLAVIGYYYQNNERGIVNYKDFICLTTKGSTASTIIKLYEYFKTRYQDDDFTLNMSNAIKGLRGNSIDAIATCAGYVMLLQLLKENYMQFPDINFSAVMKDFVASILAINDTDNYNKYWKAHFKCQYIALSLEDENVGERTARRFLDDIKALKDEENFSVYISDNHLRGFSRIDLLAFSMVYDNAGEMLKKLYQSAGDSTILKELARINYSAYLIENEFFGDAEKVLRKGNLNFLENINIDTYGSYLNNLYLAQLGCKIITLEKYTSMVSELLHKEICYNDKFIIENNLSVAYLKSGLQAKLGLDRLRDILEKGNPYNRFLAIHNLLAYYFTQNDMESFENIYNQVFVPKLLISDKTFFLNKFKWLKENMGKTKYEAFKRNPNVTTCYNELYLTSSIERWFE